MADADRREELDGRLGPFPAAVGHGKRRSWAPVRLRGLIGPGDRESPQPTAARPGPGGHDQLRHLVASAARDDAPLRGLLVERADAPAGGPDAALVVDDTAPPERGERSAGVARQDCGALGERANCRVPVSPTPAGGEVPVPLGLGPFPPEARAADPDRRAEAGVPERHRRALARTDVALGEIDRVVAAGARSGRVVADAGYGASAAFRRGPGGRGLAWAVGIPEVQDVCATTVEPLWPRAATGRPREHPVPSEEPVAAEAMPEGAVWRRAGWRRGTRGPRRRPGSPPRGCGRPGATGSGAAVARRGRRSGRSAGAGPRAGGSATSRARRRTRRSRRWRR